MAWYDRPDAAQFAVKFPRTSDACVCGHSFSGHHYQVAPCDACPCRKYRHA